VQPESGWVVCVGSDFLHPIQLHSSEEGPDQHVENWHGSDLDGLVRFWPNTSGPEASQCARIIKPSFRQNATSPLPVSHFQAWLHSSIDGLDHIVQN